MSSADGQDSKEGQIAASDPEKLIVDAGTEQVASRFHEIMVEIDEVSSLDVSESATEHLSGSIPGSLNIPYESMMGNESIEPQEDLQGIFAVLDRERPVVVYTNVEVEASLVWFALNLSGYDVRLYS